MKVYKDLIQQTPEWSILRYGKVGGSTLEKIMTNRGSPIRETAIYKDLLSARWEDYDFEEGFTTADMERGNTYEPIACDEFARIHNLTLEQYGWIESENGIYGLSPDRLFDNMKQAVECKCPKGNTHTGYILNPISMVEQYVWQVVNYFLVLESFQFEVLHFISFRPENKIKPLLEFQVYWDTKIQISKKERYTIRELVAMARLRLKELELALEADMKQNKLSTAF